MRLLYIPAQGVTPPVGGELELTWDDIANVPVTDATSLYDWNTFFQLPEHGNAFTSVSVAGNTVYLSGGSGITILAQRFYENVNLISVNDQQGVIVTVESWAFTGCTQATSFVLKGLVTVVGVVHFGGCTSCVELDLPLLTNTESGTFSQTNVTHISLPSLLNVAQGCFDNCQNTISFDLPKVTDVAYYGFLDCTAMQTCYLPLCVHLGETTSYNFVFDGITGQSIALTVPAALMTCYNGMPDLDIQGLQDSNTVTITQVGGGSSSGGGDYYVATTGSDSNDGSEGSPWLTIQHAADMVSAGKTVIVEDGVYSNTVPNVGSETAILIINTDGTASEPITFKSRNKGGAVLDGLDFAIQHGIMIYASYVVIDGFQIKDILFWAISGWQTSAHVMIKNNNFHDIGVACSDNDNGFTALHVLGNDYWTIDGNTFKNIGRLAPDEGCTITQLYRWHDHGIYVDDCDYITIQRNVFIDCDNGWAIHFYSGLGDPSNNAKVFNNTFYTLKQRSVGQVILACDMNTFEIRNNLFVMSSDANCIDFDPGDNLAIEVSGGYAITNGAITNNMKHRGNAVMAPSGSGYTQSSNYTGVANPVTDFTNYNFTLPAGSPAINAGVNVGLTTDIIGNPITGLPDIGAYEYA